MMKVFITLFTLFIGSSTSLHGQHYLDITDIGAVGDGTTINTSAIQSAIDSCYQKGGGKVLVPAGIYLTGTLNLKSNVFLYLEAGAVLLASPKQEDYSEQHPNVIYALKAKNTGIEGYGTIDGNGTTFHTKNPDGSIVWETSKMNWRPQEMIRFEKCENVFVKDATFQNSSRWTIHIVDSYRVLINGISVENAVEGPGRGPNTDGIGIDASTNVRISDCSIQSGDDSIVLKITDRPDGLKVCENIVVTNCTLHSTTSGLKIGSETKGAFKNIAFSNCTIKEASNGIGLWMRDGGSIDGWSINNIVMTLTNGQPIYLWSYRRTDSTAFGTVKNVSFSNITARGAGGIFIMGNPEQPFDGLSFNNIRITSHGNKLGEYFQAPSYPFPIWGYHKTPTNIYARYVKNLNLQDVTFIWAEAEEPTWGSAIKLEDVGHVKIGGFEGRQALGSNDAVINLNNAHDVFIYNALAPEKTGSYLNLTGDSKDVSVVGSNLSEAKSSLPIYNERKTDKLIQLNNVPPTKK